MYIGTTREQSKIVGMILMGFGFFLATPPGFIPDDFLDFFIAGYIVKFTGMPLVTALVLTYTVVAWGLIFLGALIYPYNTTSLMNGKLNYFKAVLKKIMTDPWVFFLTITMIVILYYVYSDMMKPLIMAGGAV
jgi:hypothetical protein